MSRRKRFSAVVEVDRDDQVDELVRLASNAEIGLRVFNRYDGRHLDFVNLVEVAEREDGIYVFADRFDAERFADAIRAGGSECHADETPINVGAAAERLIASERGDALEGAFGPALAEDVREGRALEAALDALRELGEGDSDAADLIRGWIELDGEMPAPSPDTEGH